MTWSLKLIMQDKWREDEMKLSRDSEAQVTCFCIKRYRTFDVDILALFCIKGLLYVGVSDLMLLYPNLFWSLLFTCDKVILPYRKLLYYYCIITYAYNVKYEWYNSMLSIPSISYSVLMIQGFKIWTKHVNNLKVIQQRRRYLTGMLETLVKKDLNIIWKI